MNITNREASQWGGAQQVKWLMPGETYRFRGWLKSEGPAQAEVRLYAEGDWDTPLAAVSLGEIGATAEAESPVDADGLVNFDALYRQAAIPTVPFTAEQALDMLDHMPAGVSVEARKQAALQAFRRMRGDQLVELTSAAEGRMSELKKEIEKGQGIIEKAKRQYNTLTDACQTQETRLDTVADFFSQDWASSKAG